MQNKKRARLSIAGNLAFVIVTSAALLALSVSAVYNGAWWMVPLIAGLLLWGGGY